MKKKKMTDEITSFIIVTTVCIAAYLWYLKYDGFIYINNRLTTKEKTIYSECLRYASDPSECEELKEILIKIREKKGNS